MVTHLGDDHPPLRHVPRGLRASRGLAAWPEHLGGFFDAGPGDSPMIGIWRFPKMGLVFEYGY